MLLWLIEFQFTCAVRKIIKTENEALIIKHPRLISIILYVLLSF